MASTDVMDFHVESYDENMCRCTLLSSIRNIYSYAFFFLFFMLIFAFFIF